MMTSITKYFFQHSVKISRQIENSCFKTSPFHERKNPEGWKLEWERVRQPNVFILSNSKFFPPFVKIMMAHYFHKNDFVLLFENCEKKTSTKCHKVIRFELVGHQVTEWNPLAFLLCGRFRNTNENTWKTLKPWKCIIKSYFLTCLGIFVSYFRVKFLLAKAMPCLEQYW